MIGRTTIAAAGKPSRVVVAVNANGGCRLQLRRERRSGLFAVCNPLQSDRHTFEGDVLFEPNQFSGSDRLV